jgi:hypothetical protein
MTRPMRESEPPSSKVATIPSDAQPERDITIALTPVQLVLVALGAIILLRLLRGWWESRARRQAEGR